MRKLFAQDQVSVQDMIHSPSLCKRRKYPARFNKHCTCTLLDNGPLLYHGMGCCLARRWGVSPPQDRPVERSSPEHGDDQEASQISSCWRVVVKHQLQGAAPLTSSGRDTITRDHEQGARVLQHHRTPGRNVVTAGSDHGVSRNIRPHHLRRGYPIIHGIAADRGIIFVVQRHQRTIILWTVATSQHTPPDNVC